MSVPNYASALFSLISWREPPPTAKKKHGRKALQSGKVTDLKPHQRHRGSLLRDIAEISIRYPKLKRGFAKQLRRLFPRYKRMKQRTLERDVAEALASSENLLTEILRKRISRKDWLELVGIEPPATMSKRALRAKAPEHLRKCLEEQLNQK